MKVGLENISRSLEKIEGESGRGRLILNYSVTSYVSAWLISYNEEGTYKSGEP